jgi:hypothetical protein
MADDWLRSFDEAHPEPGLPAHFLTDDVLVSYLSAPPTASEVAEVKGRSPHLDPTGWAMPARPLPASYRTFLGRSNGGLFVVGDREFHMLKAEELREYLFLYELPATMPGAVPFALDGAGGFYLFDTRDPPDESGEYPVLWANGGSLTYDAAADLGWSLTEAMTDGRPPGANPG